MDTSKLTIEESAKMYRDYLNNFVTVQAFADHHGLDDVDASVIIKVGRFCHDQGF